MHFNALHLQFAQEAKDMAQEATVPGCVHAAGQSKLPDDHAAGPAHAA
jgi:hypothetical protein